MVLVRIRVRVRVRARARVRIRVRVRQQNIPSDVMQRPPVIEVRVPAAHSISE